MTVTESILMESRSGQPASIDGGPAANVFFHELMKRRSRSVRIADFILSLVAIALTLPLYPFIALGVKFSTKGSVLMVQKGVGYRGFTFHAYTFRTRQGDSLTAFGRFLRLTRLEYVPLFFHVLTGKMSLVGITLRTNDTANVLNNRIEWFYKCYAAKPGIVSWASVNGYGFTTHELAEQRRQSELDLIYVMHQSTSMYFKILLKTMFDFPVSMPTTMPAVLPKSDSSPLQLHG